MLGRLRHVPVLMAGVTAAQVALVWAFPLFPSQDGPAHVYGAWVLAAMLGGEGSEFFREWYELNLTLAPNWLSHLALAALLTVLEPANADRALVSGIIILFAWGAWRAAEALRTGAGRQAVLLSPFALGWALHMGFYNFCIGLGLWLATTGWWWRRRGRDIGVTGFMGMIGWGVLIYFAHPVALGALAAVIAVGSAWSAWLESGGEKRGRALLRRLSGPLIALLPALALVVWFTSRQAPSGGSPIFFARWKFEPFFTLYFPLVTFRPVERLLGAAFAVLVVVGGAGAIARRRREGWRLEAPDALLVTAVLVFGVYLIAPPAAGGGTYLFHRIAHIPWLLAALWLCAQRVSPVFGKTLRLGGGAVACLFIALHAGRYGEFNDRIEAFVAAREAVGEPGTVAPVISGARGVSEEGQILSERTEPLLHAASWTAAGRNIVNLGDYEAGTGYFPLRWRAGGAANDRGDGETILWWSDPARAMPVSSAGDRGDLEAAWPSADGR